MRAFLFRVLTFIIPIIFLPLSIVKIITGTISSLLDIHSENLYRTIWYLRYTHFLTKISKTNPAIIPDEWEIIIPPFINVGSLLSVLLRSKESSQAYFKVRYVYARHKITKNAVILLYYTQDNSITNPISRTGLSTHHYDFAKDHFMFQGVTKYGNKEVYICNFKEVKNALEKFTDVKHADLFKADIITRLMIAATLSTEDNERLTSAE